MGYTPSWGGGGPEPCTPCSILSINSVPYNGFRPSFQIPRSGEKYVYYTCYYEFSNPPLGDIREYIQNELSDQLVAGKRYCLKFHLSLMDESKYAITEYGAYLDDGSVSAPFYGVANVTPQVSSPPGIFLTDTSGWMKIQGTFIANGTEKYLTLGNFKSNANTTFSIVSDPLSFPRDVADYYVDDVSLIEADLPAYAGRDTVICIGDSVFIGRPPEIGLECEWYSNNVNIGSGGGLWVKPASSQTFAVSQDVCGVIRYDTVRVQVKPKLTDNASLTSNFTTLCLYDTLKLNILNPPTDADVTYQWQSIAGLNNYTISNPKSIVNQSAGYTVNISSSGAGMHCPYNLSKNIFVEVKDSCELIPTLPNIFTPNNDNVNDTWGFDYSKVSYIKNIHFAIYNRWGNIILESKQPMLRWDGHTTAGIECPDGVYFYILSITDIKDNTKKYKGNITLIR